MSPDLSRELRELAPAPSGPLDVNGVWQRGLRSRRRRQVMFGAVAVTAAAIVALGALALDFTDSPDRELPPQPAGDTHSPNMRQYLRRAEARLLSHQKILREQIRKLVAGEEEGQRRLRDLRAAGSTERARMTESAIEAIRDRIAEMRRSLADIEAEIAEIRERSDR